MPTKGDGRGLAHRIGALALPTASGRKCREYSSSSASASGINMVFVSLTDGYLLEVMGLRRVISGVTFEIQARWRSASTPASPRTITSACGNPAIPTCWSVRVGATLIDGQLQERSEEGGYPLSPNPPVIG